ncbi:MAG: hypothetical protein ACOH5I_09825 [Oligoflexus sp.]
MSRRFCYGLACFFLSLLWATVGWAAPTQKNYRDYQVDFSYMRKYGTSYDDYQMLLQESREKITDRSYYEKRMDLLKKTLKKYPEWLDGYWLAASEAFQLGSSYNDPKSHKQALVYFEEGERLSRTCLEKDKEQILCKMFVASNLAGGAAIKGIIASLRHTLEIYTLWHEVAAAKLNYQITPEVSLQGSVHYALGLFNRLVPDSRLMKWFFGAKGSLQESLAHHQKNLDIDGPSPCGQLMMAVILLCAKENGLKHEYEAKPEVLLQSAEKYAGYDMNQHICQGFSGALQKNPELACGFTPAKQLTEKVPGI